MAHHHHPESDAHGHAPHRHTQGNTRSHMHGHTHVRGDGLVAAAVLTNLVLTAAQLVGGALAGSVALVADAVHNLSDALALILAFAARRIARRPAHPGMSFGYGRAEAVAALVNYTTLIVICVWLGYAAIGRLLDPPAVEGRIVVVLAFVALVINGITAALTWRLSRDSMNIRAAFLHNLSDAGTSLAVIVSGLLVAGFGWQVADPLVTIAISVWILRHAAIEIVPVIRLLMLAAPDGIADADLRTAIAAEPGVAGLHHLHLWMIDEHRVSLEAHLELAPGAEAAAVVAGVKAMLASRFSLRHVTLEVEPAGTSCAGQAC